MIWLFSLALYMYTLTARILVLIWFDLYGISTLTSVFFFFFYKGQTTVIMFILNCSIEVWKRNTYFGTDQNMYQKMIKFLPEFLCLGTI